MERLPLRAGSLLCISQCRRCIASTANAQYIFMDAPDDTTWIDTSYHPSQVFKNGWVPSTVLFFSTSTPVSTVNICQLDGSQFARIGMYGNVLDVSGNPISEMTADSFCGCADGANSSTLTGQQLQLDSSISSICLMVDVSGTMLDAKLEFPKGKWEVNRQNS